MSKHCRCVSICCYLFESICIRNRTLFCLVCWTAFEWRWREREREREAKLDLNCQLSPLERKRANSRNPLIAIGFVNFCIHFFHSLSIPRFIFLLFLFPFTHRNYAGPLDRHSLTHFLGATAHKHTNIAYNWRCNSTENSNSSRFGLETIS